MPDQPTDTPVIVVPKNPLMSTTLWVNVLSFLAMLIPWIVAYHNPDGTLLVPEAYYPILGMITGMINLILRLFITNAPIQGMSSSTAPMVNTEHGPMKKLN